MGHMRKGRVSMKFMRHQAKRADRKLNAKTREDQEEMRGFGRKIESRASASEMQK